MGTLFTIIVFVLVLGLLVLVHEFGHFYMAKRAGAQVDEFGIGFPPRIAAKEFRGTTYTLNAIPLGGFVKIAGVGPTEIDGQPIAQEKPRTGKLFNEISRFAQFAVLFAGIAMNLILAVVLFFVVHMVGATSDLSIVGSNAIVSDQRVVISAVQDDSPAAQAGLQPGDVLVESASGTQLSTAEQLQDFLSANSGAQTELLVERAGSESVSATVTPETRTNESTGEEYVGIGVALQEIGHVRYPVHVAFVEALKSTAHITGAIIVALFQLITGLFTGTADTSGLAGPIGIAAITGEVARTGFIQLVQFSAVLSINLAIFNLLPIPALDGARILFTAIETARRGKKVDQKVETMIHQIGFFLLMILVLLVTIRDIAALW